MPSLSFYNFNNAINNTYLLKYIYMQEEFDKIAKQPFSQSKYIKDNADL